VKTVRTINRDQLRNDTAAVKPFVYLTVIAGAAVYWVGENRLWNVLPKCMEQVIFTLGVVVTAAGVAVLLYDRYTVTETETN
jgi:uncharacterized membrane protein YiaA